MTNVQNIIFEEKKPATFNIFLEQFKSPLIYILLLAAVLTVIFGRFLDGIVIFFTLFVNALLGFVQEYKAQDLLFHLKKLLKPTAVVIRNDIRQKIPSEEVEISDIVVLARDYSIPADGLVTESQYLTVNEAILTGESQPVKKKPGDMIFAGTIVYSGIGKFQVTQIGKTTAIGKIGSHVQEQKEPLTPLQKQTASLARTILFVVLVLVAAIFLIGTLLNYKLTELVVTSIAVLVAAVPEGLIITLTIILAIGMQRIAKKNSVVRKLISAETLGSVTTICVDKTGTITEGNLKVVESQFIDQKLGEYSIILCNNHIDPLEEAMTEWHESKNSGQVINKAQSSQRLDEIPFNNKLKLTATLNSFGDENIIFCFGAPELIIEKCNLSIDQKKLWESRIFEIGSAGKRVIGFAYKKINTDKKQLKKEDLTEMSWNGLLVFDDPIRKGVVSALEECRSAGIKIKMITGDYEPTAVSIARQIGLIPSDLDETNPDIEPYVLNGEKMKLLDEKELRKRVLRAVVFARISPFEKDTIVKILRESGEVVAMTGDGVNDAPALKSADIGIVVNEASDISKNTADIVLLDSSFKNIVYAIKGGRVIFDNIQKVVLFLLSGSFTEIIIIIGAIFLGFPLPITAVQILWINFIEDSLPAISLAFEPEESDVMQRAPRPKGSEIITNRMKVIMASFIIISDFFMLGLLYFLQNNIPSLELLRTIIFASICIDSIFYISACRSISKSVFEYNPFTNKFLIFSIILGILMMLGAIYIPILNTLLGTVPLDFGYLVLILVIGLVDLLIIEVVKYITRNRRSWTVPF